jgi:hypothetical protein
MSTPSKVGDAVAASAAKLILGGAVVALATIGAPVPRAFAGCGGAADDRNECKYPTPECQGVVRNTTTDAPLQPAAAKPVAAVRPMTATEKWFASGTRAQQQRVLKQWAQRNAEEIARVGKGNLPEKWWGLKPPDLPPGSLPRESTSVYVEVQPGYWWKHGGLADPATMRLQTVR